LGDTVLENKNAGKKKRDQQQRFHIGIAPTISPLDAA
jgi:hypothetical protein